MRDVIKIGTREDVDFELVWKRLVNMSFTSLKEAHRYSYLAGRGAKKFAEAAHTERLQTANLDSCGGEEQAGLNQ